MIIHYITPFSTAKNIGAEYNARISELPDDCFICLRDGDTMFLTPDWGSHIAKIITANPEYDLITCMTNRVGRKELCAPGMFNVESITDHVNYANSIKSNNVIDCTMAPGYCMIFKKSVWERVKFKENSITFDKLFSFGVAKTGGKVGVATGLYLLHLYRWNQKYPQTYIKHLQ